MKKSLFLSLTLFSSFALADVDYSRCLYASGIYGARIDNDGKLQPAEWQKVKSIKTEGKRETYQLENSGAYIGINAVSEITLERDEQGRIIKIENGSQKPDQKSLEAYKKMLIQNSTMAAGMGYGSYQGLGGYGGQYQAPDFMSSEPQFYVKDKMIPLSKLSKEEAKEAGYPGNVEEIQKLKSQWRKDKKVVKKIQDGYKKILDKTSFMMPLGQDSEFEIRDNVCLVKNVSYRSYNAKTKEVVNRPGISRSTCEEIQKIHKKYEAKLNDCQETQMKVNKEYYDKKVFSDPGFYNYGGYGVAGGMVGGYVGGYGMGMMGGMYSVSPYQCELLYGVGPVNAMGGYAGGFGGNGSEASESSAQ